MAALYTPAVRVGLALPHYDDSLAGRPVTWDGVARVARLAESSGFGSVWVSDHYFLDWGKYGGPQDAAGSLECWTTISALAAITERVRIGSLTTCNDFRSPGMLAKMAATVDVLSGGRLDVGLGAGWYENEYAATGIAFDRPGTRIARLGEAAEIVGRLLSGEELTYRGRHYELAGAICRPRPVQEPRPPIWIGGKGDRLIETAVAHADGWNYSWVGSVDDYRNRLDHARRVCERRERDFGGFRRSVGCYVLAGRDDTDVASRFERLIERTPPGVLRSGSDGPAVSWEQFRTTRVAGTVAEVTDRLGRLSDLGVEEVIVSLGTLPFQVSDEDDVELVGTVIATQLT